MTYLWLKWIHILSSTILFGTGIGIAFFFFAATRHRNPVNIYLTARYVVIADWLFTAPAVVLQLITGLALVHVGGHEPGALWIWLGLLLYFFAGACWLPVVGLQIRMRNMARDCLERGGELPARYWRAYRWWAALGALAFPAVVAIFYLMVLKPV